MKRRILFIICAWVFIFPSLLLHSASRGREQRQELYPGGFTIGVNYASYFCDNWSVVLGCYTESFLFDVSYGWEQVKIGFAEKDFRLHELYGHLGFRSRLFYTNLFVTYGMLGNYGFWSEITKFRVDPYEIGVFIGLDYQISRHFLLSGKAGPYTYEKNFFKNKAHHIFKDGSITLFYVF